MKRLILAIMLIVGISACAPVLRKEIMERSLIGASMTDVRENPDLYRGKTLILGGIVANTTLTEKGSQIEALYIPTDPKGNLKGLDKVDGRFLALLPKEKGLLDPLIYTKGREVTIAGEFTGIRKGMIGEMDYQYPSFEIRAVYLWEEKKEERYQQPYYYPYPYYDPMWRRPPPPWWW